MSETEDFLAHHGILGMKWGVRKSQNSRKDSLFGNKSKKPLSFNQKNNRELAVGGGLIAAGLAIRLGGEYLLKHPDIMQRSVNTIRGTKAISVGYNVVKLNLKNGVWA